MVNSVFSVSYRASQIVGSLRMEGILVSASQERKIQGLIDGTIDAKAARCKLVEQFKAMARASA